MPTTEHATTHAIEATLAAAGSKSTYAGAGVTIGGWALSSEFAALAGVLIALAGMFINWYYRHKLMKLDMQLKREAAERDRAEHAARMGMYQ